jgi:hypothetical protein
VVITYGNTLYSLASKKQTVVYSNNVTSDKIKTSLVSVFPNPSHDYTSVTFNSLHTQCTLTMSNVQGKNLYQKTLEQVNKGMSEKIPLNGLAKGIYFLKVCCDDETVQTEKIIVE